MGLFDDLTTDTTPSAQPVTPDTGQPSSMFADLTSAEGSAPQPSLLSRGLSGLKDAYNAGMSYVGKPKEAIDLAAGLVTDPGGFDVRPEGNEAGQLAAKSMSDPLGFAGSLSNRFLGTHLPSLETNAAVDAATMARGKVEHPGIAKAADFVSGFAKGGAEDLGSMTTDPAMYAIPNVKGLGLAFAPGMLGSAWDAAKRAYQSGFTPEGGRAAAEAIFSGGMGTLAGVHGAIGLATPGLEEMAPDVWKGKQPEEFGGPAAKPSAKQKAAEEAAIQPAMVAVAQAEIAKIQQPQNLWQGAPQGLDEMGTVPQKADVIGDQMQAAGTPQVWDQQPPGAPAELPPVWEGEPPQPEDGAPTEPPGPPTPPPGGGGGGVYPGPTVDPQPLGEFRQPHEVMADIAALHAADPERQASADQAMLDTLEARKASEKARLDAETAHHQRDAKEAQGLAKRLPKFDDAKLAKYESAYAGKGMDQALQLVRDEISRRATTRETGTAPVAPEPTQDEPAPATPAPAPADAMAPVASAAAEPPVPAQPTTERAVEDRRTGVEQRAGERGHPARRIGDRRDIAAQVGLPEDHPAVALASENEIAAHTDPLTGLLNKRAHMADMQSAGGHASLDMASLKGINDEFGHVAGDDFIRDVATQIKGVADRMGARAYRIGGDEFALTADSEAHAHDVAKAVKDQVAQHGISLVDADGKVLASLPGARVDYGYAGHEGFRAADQHLIDYRKRAESLPPDHPEYRPRRSEPERRATRGVAQEPAAPAPAGREVSPAGTDQALVGEPAAPGIGQEPKRQVVPDVERVAESYIKDKGIAPLQPFKPHDEQRAKAIADWFQQAHHDPENPEVRRSYEAAKNEIDSQWKHLEANGYTMEPWTGEGQPYKNSAEMAADVRDNKHVYFFKGGDIPADHPLAEVNPELGISYNDQLRAVHDVFGHAERGYQFGPRGEDWAYKRHLAMFSPEARPAVAAETRAQNSWVNFGEHLRNAEGDIPKKGEEGYAPPSERPYAEQKATTMPAEFLYALRARNHPLLGNAEPVEKQRPIDEVKQEAHRITDEKNGPPPETYGGTADRVARFVKVVGREIASRLKMIESGAEWYKGDIADLHAIAEKQFPELSDPSNRAIFKAITAMTSFGNDPNVNLQTAMRLWSHFDKTGELPFNQPGTTKGWPGTAAKVQFDRLQRLVSEKGRDGAAQWLEADHPIKELREWNTNVPGKMAGEKPGFFILGEKGGPFALNLSGRPDFSTIDLWASRSWNRALGILRPGKGGDTPANESERADMINGWEAVAKKNGLTPAQAQAVEWYFERDLYDRLGQRERGGSFAAAGRREVDSMAGEDVTPQDANVAFEIEPSTFLTHMGLEKSMQGLPLGTRTRLSQQIIGDTAEAVGRQTGVRIKRGVFGAGVYQGDTNPNLIATVSGNHGQVLDFMHMIGHVLRQGEVVAWRDGAGGNRAFVDIVPEGVDLSKLPNVEALWKKVQDSDQDMSQRGASVVSVGGKNGVRIILNEGEGLDRTARVAIAERARQAFGNATGEAVDALHGLTNFESAGNDWEASPNGEGYRQRLDSRGYTGLDRIDSAVRKSFTNKVGAARKRAGLDAPAAEPVAAAPAQGVAKPQFAARPNKQGFYSQLESVAEKIPQAMRGDDMLRYLSDSKRGVKADELEEGQPLFADKAGSPDMVARTTAAEHGAIPVGDHSIAHPYAGSSEKLQALGPKLQPVIDGLNSAVEHIAKKLGAQPKFLGLSTDGDFFGVTMPDREGIRLSLSSVVDEAKSRVERLYPNASDVVKQARVQRETARLAVYKLIHEIAHTTLPDEKTDPHGDAFYAEQRRIFSELGKGIPALRHFVEGKVVNNQNAVDSLWKVSDEAWREAGRGQGAEGGEPSGPDRGVLRSDRTAAEEPPNADRLAQDGEGGGPRPGEAVREGAPGDVAPDLREGPAVQRGGPGGVAAAAGELPPGYRLENDAPDAWRFYSQDMMSRVYDSRGDAIRAAYQDYDRSGGNRRIPAPHVDNVADPRDNANFRSWFADSKAVRDDGRPLVAFHGTKGDRGDFTVFDTRPQGKSGKNPNYSGDMGSWFSAESKHKGNYDPENAESVAGSFTEDGNFDTAEGANVKPVHLSIQNPAEFGDFDEFRDERGNLSGKAFREKLERAGHDGIVIRNSMTDGDVDRDDWVAFHPEQIKSAIGNRGTFDPKNPDIRFASRVRPIPDRPTPVAGTVPPLATGRPMAPGEAPRVEAKVESLRDVEGRAGLRESGLDRDTVRSHPEVEAEANRLLRTESEQTLLNRAQKGKLTDAEVMAVDSIRQKSIDSFESASDALKKARMEGSGVSEANANFVEAAFDRAAKEAAARVRTDVNAGTAIGRALSARARVMSAGRSMPDAFLRKIFREMDGVTDEQAANLVKVMQQDPGNLADAIHRAIQPGKLSKWLELWKAGLISAPGTQLANIAGNVGEQVARVGETLTAAAVDSLLGGKRMRFLSEAKAEVAGGFSRVAPALGRLGQDLSDIVRLRPEAIDLKSPLERQVGAISGKKGRFARIPFRLLQAFDNFFKDTGGGAELGKLAYRKAAIELGPTSDRESILARAEQIRSEAMDPDNADHGELLAKVAEARQLRTFQGEPGELIGGLIKLRSKNPILHVLAPFLQTPGAIAKLTFERSPYGFIKAKGAYDAWKFADTSGAAPEVVERLRGEAVDAIARPLMGTVMLGAFAAYAKSGGMTGSGPTDPKERNVLRESGWQPYSFVGINPTSGKKFYVPFNRFEPVSSILGIAADMAELKDEKKTGDIFNKALGSIASNITSKTYLQGLSDAAAMISKPDQFASQYVSNLAGSVIPNIVAKGAQAIDPTLRDSTTSSPGLVGIPERIGKTLASRIPGASEMLPARRGATGEDVMRPGEGLLGAASRFALPVQVTEEKPGTDLERTLVEVGAVPSPVKSSVSIKGKRVELTRDEVAAFTEADKKATAYLRGAILSSAFTRMDEDQKHDFIERVYSRYRSAARTKVYGRSDFVRRAREAQAT